MANRFVPTRERTDPRRRANTNYTSNVGGTTLKKLALGISLVSALVVASSAFAMAMPTVKFVSPKAGAMTGSKVTFTVALTNFKLDAANVGKAKKPNDGHIHFQMDGGKYDFPKYSGANGTLAVKLGIAGKYSPAVTTSITYTGLPKGKHTLVAILANNDHSPVGPTAHTTVTVG